MAMKTLFTSFFCILSYLQYSQNTFFYSPVEPQNNIILDALIHNDTLLALQISIDTLKSSDLLILDTDGNLLSRSELGGMPFNAMRFLKVIGNEVFLLGKFKTDSCESLIATVKYNMQTKEISVISEVPFCDKNVQNLRLASKLDSTWFVNGYWVDIGYKLFLLNMDKELHLTLFMDSMDHQRVSIDFSRKGYVLKDDGLCNFYDKDFNYRKQRYNFIQGPSSLHQTHIPYDENYILESFGGSYNYENDGHYIRLVDSNLHEIKLLYISPGIENNIGYFEPPFFGGVDYYYTNELWIAGNNNLTQNLNTPTHFSISKINENFIIDCNQYIGFDAYYRMYGLRATDDGGVLVYGMKYNESYDPFLIKLGPNCELPTVSTEDEDIPLISISAYPNPGINELSFSIQGFDPSGLRVELIDMVGKVLFSADDLSTNIEVEDFPAGQYFYRILQKDRLLGVGSWVKQ